MIVTQNVHVGLNGCTLGLPTFQHLRQNKLEDQMVNDFSEQRNGTA